MKAKMCMANELYVVAPRGTGKTEEILAHRAIEAVKQMPRGKGAMIAISYKKLKTQLLPPLVKSWEKMGFQRHKHFWIGNDPRPKNWVIDTPFIAPIENTDFIQFANGHGIHLISQDRPGMANGLSVEWIAADEARLMNKQRYDEDASAILRGHAAIFGDKPLYNSVTMTTDMPLIEDGLWILELEKEMDSEKVEALYEMAINLELMIQEQEAREKPDLHLQADINKLQAMVDELRRETVQYIEVSDGSNLIFLGEKFIKTQMRVMERTRFNASILGLRPSNFTAGFYPAFNRRKHGYYKANVERLANFGLDDTVDCRTDGDVLHDRPLHIAFDHNASINWIGVAQMDGRVHRTLCSHYVLGREGKRLKDLLQWFIDYYLFHPNKKIVYHYDHTSVGTDASTDVSFKDEILETLGKAKWEVTEHYLGKAPFHDFKFKTIREIHSEDVEGKVKSRVNLDNNEQLVKVLELTQGKVTGDKWEKDKTKEKQVKNFPQEDAPHGSDMYDLLVLGVVKYEGTDLSWMIA